MRRYYPRLRALLLVPALVSIALSPGPLGSLRRWSFSATFFLAIVLFWRHRFRVVIDEKRVRGRHHETDAWSEVDLDSVVSCTRVCRAQIKGWALQDASGSAVFVNETALADPRIRQIVDRLGAPDARSGKSGC
jgi:hypothetical protein